MQVILEELATSRAAWVQEREELTREMAGLQLGTMGTVRVEGATKRADGGAHRPCCLVEHSRVLRTVFSRGRDKIYKV